MRGTTITINGQLYDAHTGLPVTAETAPQKIQASTTPGQAGKVMSDVGIRPAQNKVTPQTPPISQSVTPATKHVIRSPKTAHSIHNAPQRSKTLYRAALQRPKTQEVAKPTVLRSPAIQKFSPNLQHSSHTPHTQAHTHHVSQQPETMQNSQGQPHPTTAQQPAQLQGSALKEKLIADKMASIMPKKEKESKTAKRRRTYPRLATVTSGIAALVLLGGYLTYLNLPNLSLRVAASQAGVAATYPTYQPSGYGFAGPVAYSSGEVRVNFKSNTNDYAYSVVQRESNWDSQAVRDNYVIKESKQYTTIQEGGITIYLVNNKAVWVNGGVLYSVEGNAPLSGEQIQKIASSTL
ncbi:MAG TPA: DUF4367 domain-containing protein [Candidatus Saccharimonadales bacterium]